MTTIYSAIGFLNCRLFFVMTGYYGFTVTHPPFKKNIYAGGPFTDMDKS